MIYLFSTPLVYVENCNLDLEQLERKCREHMVTQPPHNKSNIGGYQGHYINIHNMGSYMNDNSLYDLIAKNIPRIKTKPIKSFKYEAWVNVHPFGASNERHNHDPHSGTFMSGVFYVKCPEGCGKIRFYDPRPNINTAFDMRYYNDANTNYWFAPVANTLIMFPAWLEHAVDPNQSQEERISISFNIFDVEWTSQV